MTLDQYMSEQGLSDAEVAALVECDRSRINRLRRGKELPSLRLAVRIQNMTKGTVMPADFVARYEQVAA